MFFFVLHKQTTERQANNKQNAIFQPIQNSKRQIKF